MVRNAPRRSCLIAGYCLSLALAACATSKPLATPVPAPKPAPAATPKPSTGDARLDQYQKWISEARIKHPYADSEARMYAVMMCESGGKASIVNPAGPYTGLFQYATPTWKAAWNTYRNESILDAKSQIFATALAWSLKMQGQWGCYKKTG